MLPFVLGQHAVIDSVCSNSPLVSIYHYVATPYPVRDLEKFPWKKFGNKQNQVSLFFQPPKATHKFSACASQTFLL